MRKDSISDTILLVVPGTREEIIMAVLWQMRPPAQALNPKAPPKRKSVNDTITRMVRIGALEQWCDGTIDLPS